MFLDSIFSFIILLMLSFSIYKLCKINPSTAPFVALVSIVTFVSFASLFNFLIGGIWAVYLVSIIGFAVSIKKSKTNIKQDLADFFTPGVALFCVFSILMFIILALQTPTISLWDEFSIWGTGAKLTKIKGAIYTFYDSSLIGRTTPPAPVILSTFFQPIGNVFLEWKAFFAYDVLFLASFCAWTAAFKKDKWNLAFLVFLFGFMTPYVFEVYTKIVYLAPMYISLMIDIPLGITFAGAVAVYMFGKGANAKSHNYILAVVPVLMALTFLKDMGFALSLIVIFIVFFDMMLTQKEFVFLKLKGIPAKLVSVIVLGVGVLASFISWTVHMGIVLQANRFELGGDRSLGMLEMLIVGIKELFSPQKSQKFLDMTGEMITALFTRPVSMFGNGIVTILVITAIFIISAVLAKRKKDVVRIISLYVTSLISFVGYYIFHLFLYVYIFKANAYGLPSYERYVYPFYIAWLAFAVFMLCVTVKNARWQMISTLSIYGFVLGLFVLFNYYVSYENTFILYNADRYSLTQNVTASVESIKDVVDENDVIYCYSDAEDMGLRRFIYSYAMVPTILAQDVPWFDPEDMTEQEYAVVWRQYLLKHIEDSGITHIMVDYGGDLMQYALGEELGRDVREIGLSNVAYYEIVQVSSENDSITLKLLKEGNLTD